MPLWLALLGFVSILPAIMFLVHVCNLAVDKEATRTYVASRQFWIELILLPAVAAIGMGIVLSLSYWNCLSDRTPQCGIGTVAMLVAPLGTFVLWMGLGLLIRRQARQAS